MEVYEFGSSAADSVLIQPVDNHCLSLIENEAAAIAAQSDRDFRQKKKAATNGFFLLAVGFCGGSTFILMVIFYLSCFGE